METNPLNSFIGWFELQDLDWADSIAMIFFRQSDMLTKSHTLLETSRAEYQMMIDLEIKKFDDPNYQPGPDSYFYEHNDFEDGEEATRLINYLRKFIELEDDKITLAIANSLYVITESTLMDHKSANAKDMRDYYKEAGIASLLQGDKDKADYYEKELQEHGERIEIKKRAKESWERLKHNTFSLTDIYRYNSHSYEE